MPDELLAAGMAQRLVQGFAAKRLTVALAESCTAGLVSDLVARVSGASNVLWGSFVCYTADAKEKMLRIDRGFLERHGLVSRETVREMALRALGLTGASVAAAVTGIAGPLGDGSSTPAGTVWTAVATREQCRETEHFFSGDRAEVRMKAAMAVLEDLLASQSCLQVRVACKSELLDLTALTREG